VVDVLAVEGSAAIAVELKFVLSPDIGELLELKRATALSVVVVL
jgi:hypothetical protein